MQFDFGPDPVISYIRETTLLTDETMAAYVAAQQIGFDRDFKSVWGVSAHCVFVPPGGVIPAGSWEVIVNDTVSMEGALGYHDDTGDGGTPRSYIGVQLDVEYGTRPTTTLSHESWEMRLNPWLRNTVQVTDVTNTTYEYPLEAADACEDDKFAYLINDVWISDFVTPAWFDPKAGGPYTFRNSIHRPFVLADGGYTGRREVAPAATDWTQIFAQVPGRRQIKKPYSRTMRIFKTVTETAVHHVL